MAQEHSPKETLPGRKGTRRGNVSSLNNAHVRAFRPVLYRESGGRLLSDTDRVALLVASLQASREQNRQERIAFKREILKIKSETEAQLASLSRRMDSLIEAAQEQADADAAWDPGKAAGALANNPLWAVFDAYLAEDRQHERETVTAD